MRKHEPCGGLGDAWDSGVIAQFIDIDDGPLSPGRFISNEGNRGPKGEESFQRARLGEVGGGLGWQQDGAAGETGFQSVQG